MCVVKGLTLNNLTIRIKNYHSVLKEKEKDIMSSDCQTHISANTKFLKY